MTRTPLGGHAEHFVAWLGTAMVFGLASQRPRALAAQCLLLSGYAALLEGGQLYSAGRHASFHDFAFSAAGVLLGSTAIWIARRCWLRSASRIARRCHFGQTTASGDAVAMRDPLPSRTIIAAMSEGAPHLRGSVISTWPRSQALASRYRCVQAGCGWCGAAPVVER